MELRIFTEPQQGARYADLLAVALRAERLGFTQVGAEPTAGVTSSSRPYAIDASGTGSVVQLGRAEARDVLAGQPIAPLARPVEPTSANAVIVVPNRLISSRNGPTDRLATK